MKRINMLLLLAFAVQAGADDAANLAAGAPYALDPTPAYEHCTDPGDVSQLTDGVYTQGHFWTQKSTVGWSNANPILISFDLGEVKPIRGVSFSTAAGTAGVAWPAAIHVFVADEAQAFHWAGDLVQLSGAQAPTEGYAQRVYRTEALRTHGRYITLLTAAQPYLFVDEIEIYEGEPAWKSEALHGETISDIKAFANRLTIRVAVQRRIQRDMAALRDLLAASNVDDATKNDVLAELQAVDDGLAGLPVVYPESFMAVLPLNDLHARVFRAQAKLWNARGLPPMTVWQSGLWDALKPIEHPQVDMNPRVEVWMMQNEYRAASINISNATSIDMPIALQFDGLPGGPAPDYVAVHQVAWTDTRTGDPVAAALPSAERAGDGYIVRAAPGLTRQLWFTFHPQHLEPGRYQGTIKLKSLAGAEDVPLALTVYPIRFPDNPSLKFGGWDYTDRPNMYQVTPENRASLIAHLREHYVDSPWATSAVMPHGQYDADGIMTEPPDTAEFDSWVGRWKGAEQYCVFAAVQDHLRAWEMGEPQFETAVKAWIRFWANHVQEIGLGPEQIAILLFDEPYAPEHDAIIAAWAKPIREEQTGIRLWVDPTYRTMHVTESVSIAACDVVCPNRQIFYETEKPYRDFFENLRVEGKTLEFYSCSGPARLLDPYLYHRLQAWTCWEYGATAMYFWAFADTGGGSSWNEYPARGTSYTPLFLDAASVTAGKHMEACREGIEDYEYLAMLKDAIAAAEKAGASEAELSGPARLLRELPARINSAYDSAAGFHWGASVDRTAADQARREILEALVALQERGRQE